MSANYTDIQLDALRELANIGSGTAGTALSQLIGRPIDVSVPSARALPFAAAVDAAGDPEDIVTGVVLPIFGDIEGTVLLLIPGDDAMSLCAMLGVQPGSEVADSALGEVGNILGSSYIGALAAMTGMAIEPRPPQSATDMLGAVVATVLASGPDPGDVAMMLDSKLFVEGEECGLSFMLVPTPDGVADLLARLGLGA